MDSMNQKRIGFVIGLVLILLAGTIFVTFQTSNSTVKKFSSLQELESFVEANTDTSYEGKSQSLEASAIVQPGTGSNPSAGDASSRTSSPGYSTTNVQVSGVDEPDIVKNDGKYVYVASGSNISIISAYPAEQASISSIINVNGTINSIFIKDDKLIVFGQESFYYQKCMECDRPLASEGDASRQISQGAYPYYQPRAFLTVYDVSDKEQPQEVDTLIYEGSYYDARMINNYVYLIANQPLIRNEQDIQLPSVIYSGVEKSIAADEIAYFPVQDYGYQLTTIFAINLADNDITRNSFLTGYTQTLYVSENNIYLTSPKYVSYQDYNKRKTEYVLLPLLKGDARDKIKQILQDTSKEQYQQQQEIEEIFEFYYNSLSQDEKSAFEKDGSERAQKFEADWQKETQKTVIHKISIDKDKITYAAKGEVPGFLLNQFSLDEYNGNLRVATTTQAFFGGPVVYARGSGGGSFVEMPAATVTTSAPENESDNLSPQEDDVAAPDESTIQTGPIETRPISAGASKNHVYVLDDNLDIVGKLEDLAPGETIYSARFIKNRAYLVTFKQLDPLFVIDLSSPRYPKVLGELKIPGYSTYLHPYDETHIIGLGQDTSGEVQEGSINAAIPAGLKLALFDVSDVENPREVSKYNIGDRGSLSDALYNHKAFLFDKEKNILVLPVTVYDKSTNPKELWSYGRLSFEGAYVFSLDLENGFQLKGKVTHLNASEQDAMKNNNESYGYYPPYDSHIMRSLYIDNTLYTLSQRELKANDLGTLEEIKTIRLPFEQQVYYMYAAQGVGFAT